MCRIWVASLLFAATAFAWPESPQYCEWIIRLGSIPAGQEREYGSRSGLHKTELQEILQNGNPRADAPTQYRNGRSFVAKIPKQDTVLHTVQLKSVFLFDLYWELAFSGASWNFRHYVLADGSHVFEGAGGDQPVTIIRGSDAAMFRGNRPQGMSPSRWTPNFDDFRQLD